jgi:hypothetical protein
MRKAILIVLSLLCFTALVASCNQEAADPGTLEIYATGGDRVFVGMISKDGWKMVFNHFYITMKDVTSYQTDPPYDPVYSADIIRYETSVKLDGTFTVDIAQGDGRRLVGSVPNAPVGFYNAVSWFYTPGEEGEAAGHSVVMVGQAAKDGELVDFTIKLAAEGGYQCGEYYSNAADHAEKMGDLASGEVAEQEITIAVETLFGDAALPAQGVLNQMALGFEPFAAFLNDGVLDVTLADLEAQFSAEDYELLMTAISELSRVGEGRCHYFEP